MLGLFRANISPGGSGPNPDDLSNPTGFNLLVVMVGLLWVLSLCGVGLGVLCLFG